MDLLTRLHNHRAMMAPHQKDRHGGKLLLEAINEIERLLGWIEKTGEEHDFCTWDAHPDRLCASCNCHRKPR